MIKLPGTKIVATIGPSTWDDKVLIEMINSGFCIARINASFADEAELERVSTQLRRLSPRVAVMLDTMGHKVRVTGFEDERVLVKGDQVKLCSEAHGKIADDVIQVTYPTLESDLTRGVVILIDDGNLSLKVTDIKEKVVMCEVIQGGVLKKRKTVNIPGVHLNFPSLSEKDERDIKYAVANSFDLISASFVRNAEDVRLVREAMGETDIKLIAKIEDYEGVQNFDEILEVVDGIMVARGDLGVELPAEEVPFLQKQFIDKCRSVGKPVIVATQMLESMKENVRPTRAEVSDVANAVLDGADALMLSAESSTGKHPIEAVKVMATVAQRAELESKLDFVEGRTEATESTDAICKHLCTMADELKLKGFIVLSTKGHTVASLARHRSTVPIWNISTNLRLIRQLSLFRNVKGYYVEDFSTDRDNVIKQAVEIVYSHGELDIEDKIAVITGSPILARQSDTILEILTVKEAMMV